MEALIHWHHHLEDSEHEEKEHLKNLHPVVYLSFIGAGVHNFIDGVIIAASFLASIKAGIASSLAIVFHEIPHEFGDFAVLINGGLKFNKALLINFLSAIFAIAGGIIGYFVLDNVRTIIPAVTLIAAGGLIYIATADLFPQLHQEKESKKVVMQIIGIILGIVVIATSITLMKE